MFYELTGKDCNVVVNALRVAAEQFDKDCETCKHAGIHNATSEHFLLQAEECRALADKIEEEA